MVQPFCMMHHCHRISVALAHYDIFRTLFFLFSNTLLVFRAEIHKMFVRIANIEEPDQTALEAV